MSDNETLTLNPKLNKQDSKQIQLSNTQAIASTPPLITQENTQDSTKDSTQNQNIESNIQSNIESTQNTAQDSTQINTQNQNDIFESEEYKKFVGFKQKALEAYKKVYENDKGYIAKIDEIRDEHKLENVSVGMAMSQISDEKIRNLNLIYDFKEKFGDPNNEFAKANDAKEIENAKLRAEIYNTKNLNDLSPKAKNYLKKDTQSIFGYYLWDLPFRSEEDILKIQKEHLIGTQIDPNLRRELYTLSQVSDANSITSFAKSDATNQKNLDKYLQDATTLVQKHGSENDFAAIDKRSGDLVVIIDGKVYNPGTNEFFANFDKEIASNLVGFAAGMIPIGRAVKTTANIAQKAALLTTMKNLAKTSAQAAGVSALAAPLDYKLNLDSINRAGVQKDFSTSEAISKSLDNAISTFAIGMGLGAVVGGSVAGVKAIKNTSADAIKDSIKNTMQNVGGKVTDKISNITTPFENMYIWNELRKYKKDDVDLNYQRFKNLQSDNFIQEDIKPSGSMGKILDTINEYFPYRNLTNKNKEQKDKLLANIFADKNLSAKFSNLLDAEETQYISRAFQRNGENLQKAIKQYENDFLQDYIKNTNSNAKNIAQVVQELVGEVKKESQSRYKNALTNLDSIMQDIDLKSDVNKSLDDLFTKSTQELPSNNPLQNYILKLAKDIDSKERLSISDAIEIRKDLNEKIANMNKSNNTNFKAKETFNNLKNDIDNSIKTHLESKIANKQIDSTQGNNIYNEWINANKHYAEVAESIKDKYTQAILESSKESKKRLNSMLTEEQWKQKVFNPDLADSINSLDNTIFKHFKPQMRENMQMFFIFKAINRNIQGMSDNKVMDIEKILSDIELLENMTLHPKVIPVLELFKDYAKLYRFSQDLLNSKSMDTGVGNGALSTSIEGRLAVVRTNLLFKHIIALIPFLGRKASLINSFKDAVKNLKYPREITLNLIQTLEKEDIKSGKINTESKVSKTNESELAKAANGTSQQPLLDNGLKKSAIEYLQDENIASKEILNITKDAITATQQKLGDLASKDNVIKHLQDNTFLGLKDSINTQDLIAKLQNLEKPVFIYSPKSPKATLTIDNYKIEITDKDLMQVENLNTLDSNLTPLQQALKMDKDAQEIDKQALDLMQQRTLLNNQF